MLKSNFPFQRYRNSTFFVGDSACYMYGIQANQKYILVSSNILVEKINLDKLICTSDFILQSWEKMLWGPIHIYLIVLQFTVNFRWCTQLN